MIFDERLYKIKKANVIVINKYIITDDNNPLMIDPSRTNNFGTLMFTSFEEASKFMKDNSIPIKYQIGRIPIGLFIERGYVVKKIFDKITIYKEGDIKNE